MFCALQVVLKGDERFVMSRDLKQALSGVMTLGAVSNCLVKLAVLAFYETRRVLWWCFFFARC